MDAQTIKTAAAGRWLEILTDLGGVDRTLLDGKGHPCPKCGGTDRFALVDADAGAVICRKCFDKRNGDGFSALQWLTGEPFPTVVRRVSEYLNLHPGSATAAKPTNKPAKTFPTARAAVEDLEHRLGKRSAAWTYRDATGEPVGLVARFDLPDGKTIRPISRTPAGWIVGAMPDPRPLYRLGDIPDAGTVYVVEGEKCADAGASIGLPCVTSAGGSKAAKKADWSPLAGRDVAILPDADQPGEDYAKAVAAILGGLGATVRIVRLPGLSEGDDLADWIDARNAVDPQVLREQLEAMPGDPPDTSAPTGESHQSATRTGREPRRTTLHDAVGNYFAQLSTGRQALLTTGLEDVDYLIGGGIAPGEVVIIGARPGHGKSAFALQAIHENTRTGVPCVLVSEEMSATALAKRTVQYAASMPEEHWTTTDTTRELGEHFAGRAPCRIVESCGTADRAVAEIRRAVDEIGARLAVVDYAQLLRSDGRGRYEQVTNTSITLRQAANETGVALLLLCQLSRAIETREKFRPTLGDLRDSGQLEQDADVILFLAWPHRLDAERDRREYMVFAAKNRNRGINQPVATLQFNPLRQRIEPPPARQTIGTDRFAGDFT